MKFTQLSGSNSKFSPVIQGENSCCCPAQGISTPDTSTGTENNAPYITGYKETVAGSIPRVSTELSLRDKWEHVKARISSFRMSFSVIPGIYAAGDPGENSDVFVTSNYKMSFDKLRVSLNGMDAWILVLDTAGINVWCAAGKGTFGTVELLRRLALSGLLKIVSHRKIIMPQLGAPGIDSGEVRRKSGFRVLFGPVRAEDIGKYIQNGFKADAEMREIKFGFMDRLILTPIEFYMILPKLTYFVLFFLIIFGLNPQGILFRDAWFNGYLFLAGGLLSVLSGAFLTPVLLPFIPFRAFSVKGWIMGVVLFISIAYFTEIPETQSIFLSAAEFILFPLISSYLALQFTGATTFTSLSGVKKELKYSLPVYIAGTIISFGCLILYKISEWGII